MTWSIGTSAKARNLVFFATIAIAFVSSCVEGPATERTDPVEPHRAIWNAAGISNYEFLLVPAGAAPPSPPLHIVVKNGQVLSASIPCPSGASTQQCDDVARRWSGRGETSRFATNGKTIPQIFDEVVEDQLRAKNSRAQVQIAFDPTYGFPSRFYVDDPQEFDEEFGFHISQFKVLAN